MKALDKVFDTQVITGIVVTNFISLEQESFLYEEGKKTDKKTVSKVTIVTEENPTEFIKSKWMEHWTVYQVTNYMIQLILKNLTSKFGLKHQVIIILKSWV